VKVLECSSRGDRRFSAFFASLPVDGKQTTIEAAYQGAKRFSGEPPAPDWRANKGRKPDRLVIGRSEVSGQYARAYYDLLWVKYLDSHPELVEEARSYDEFTDMFARPGSVSQADSIRAYVKEGRESIMGRADVRLLLFELRQGGLGARGVRRASQLRFSGREGEHDH
jgi:hypothetical protein